MEACQKATALLREAGYLLPCLVSLATVTGLYFWLDVPLPPRMSPRFGALGARSRDHRAEQSSDLGCCSLVESSRMFAPPIVPPDPVRCTSGLHDDPLISGTESPIEAGPTRPRRTTARGPSSRLPRTWPPASHPCAVTTSTPHFYCVARLFSRANRAKHYGTNSGSPPTTDIRRSV
jgi:hypothetical protein